MGWGLRWHETSLRPVHEELSGKLQLVHSILTEIKASGSGDRCLNHVIGSSLISTYGSCMRIYGFILYGGVYFCSACGATAVNKLIEVSDPCIPLRHGHTNYNLKAFEAGKATQGFSGWPFKHIHACTPSVVSTIQRQVDVIADSFRDQEEDISAASTEDEICSGFSSYYHITQ